jgi:hypothetical protein
MFLGDIDGIVYREAEDKDFEEVVTLFMEVVEGMDWNVCPL